MNLRPVLALLKITALLSALLAVVQMVVGFGWVPMHEVHGLLGNVTFAVAALAAVAAFVWSRRTGDRGIFMHAAGMAVIALAQVALGEMGVRTVHQVLGVVFLVGAVALATLALRRTTVAVEAGARDALG